MDETVEGGEAGDIGSLSVFEGETSEREVDLGVDGPSEGLATELESSEGAEGSGEPGGLDDTAGIEEELDDEDRSLGLGGANIEFIELVDAPPAAAENDP